MTGPGRNQTSSLPSWHFSARTVDAINTQIMGLLVVAEVGGVVNWEQVRIKNPHQNKFYPELRLNRSQWETKKSRLLRTQLSQYRDKDTAARKRATPNAGPVGHSRTASCCR